MDIILVNERDEPIGKMEKMEVHKSYTVQGIQHIHFQ